MTIEASSKAETAPTSSHLIGRDRELDFLGQALDELASGRGGLLLLVGDAGMGKTSLCRELAAEASRRDLTVLTGSAWEAVDAPAFWPWIQVLRQLEGPEGSTRFAQHDGRFQLFDSVASSLVESSEIRPMVVILEDLHAADESTLVLLRFMHRALIASPVLVLGTYDEREAKADNHRERLLSDLTRETDNVLQLTDLDEAAVARICDRMAGEHLSESLVRSIHEASEGNPLFVIEATRVLTAKGDIHRPDYSVGFRVPRGLKGLIRRRLESLSEERLVVLSIASVLGRQFDVSFLQEVAGVEVDPLLGLMDDCVAAGVIEETGALGRYAFVHIMVRETVYEDLTSARRMRLHRMVAEALERAYKDDLEPRLAELAHHWFKAAQAGDPHKAIDYARRAAVIAEDRGAYEEAVRLYRRALKVAESTGQAGKEIRALHAALSSVENRVAPFPKGTRQSSNRFVREGDYWTIAYEGTTTRLKDARGLRHIHVLLTNSGREIHALELVQLGAGRGTSGASPPREDGLRIASNDAGAVLDATAKASYKARLADLREEIEEANAFGDPERASRAHEELDALTRELAGAFGVGGRDRKAVSQAQRARVSVQKAIRDALRRIDAAAPSLGNHLTATIRTGTFCVYEPDPRAPVGWQL